ncbi:separin [Alligator mississippiensis]|uniref:separase n=1 Tax=Alligator mississippiensis TaxID=8496 RepID=A0A151P4Y3_ALLMI|nr:separin [Alligator mississippiensis]KYO44124.1 separin [Alligator mississippiensis]
MKRLKGADFMAQAGSREEAEALLAELKECLACAPEDLASSSQPSWQGVVCDKVLRACIHWLGLSQGCVAHFQSLLDLAELACQGYIVACPPRTPLYLEKILYHLLKSVAASGTYSACLRFAGILRTQLGQCQRLAVPNEDFEAIAKSSFSVLWKGADALAKSDQGLGDARVVLSGRLQATCFLALLEEAESPLLPQEPPFFTSQTVRQAAVAALMFEAQRTPLSPEDARYLSEQLACHPLAVLLEARGGMEPWPLQSSLCLLELTLERCRRLCRGSCFQEAEDALKQARVHLSVSRGAKEGFVAALDLLRIGIELSRVLAVGQGQTGPLLSQAAMALDTASEAQDPLLRALVESCQFMVSSLSGYVRRSEHRPFGLEDALGASAFVKGYFQLLRRLLESMPPDSPKQQQTVKQLQSHCLQLYAGLAYDAFQGSQAAGLEKLAGPCRDVITRMLQLFEGLPEPEQAEYLDVTASCVFKLAYGFYSQKLYAEACSVVELFCQRLAMEPCPYPEMPTERSDKCFKLQVESYRKLGQFEKGLEVVALWLGALRGRVTEQMVEPVSLWVRVKMDASKKGDEDLRLKTLKDALEEHSLAPESLVALLSEELRAYKMVRADTGHERFNVICDLLELYPEESGQVQERAGVLLELAQVLCYHDYTEKTECSALDAIREALHLLDSVPESPESQDQLLDDRAQALLWLYICSLESKMQQSIEKEQRAWTQGQKNLEDFEPNDLNYEDKLQDDKFLYNSIAFNLAAEAAQSKSLDDALALWKKLLAKKGIPQVRSVEQTTASLHLAAALYRMMAKPLQAVECYLLLRTLCRALEDQLGTASALCQVTKLLFHLECPSDAKLFLEEAESCLENADSSSESSLLLKQTCAVLRSQLCCMEHKIEEGLALLLKVLQSPTLQRIAKVWYLLRAHILQLVAVYLGLPSTSLSAELRQQIWAEGWKTPETALADAHKLLRSIILLLLGSDVLSSPKAGADASFVDYGENLLQKWQVLADMLACSEKLIALLGTVEMVCEAKAFCVEALKLSMKLQALRWCAGFLVQKSELELQRSDVELCQSDLQQALFLLESGTAFETEEKHKDKVKIQLTKGRCRSRQHRSPSTESAAEDEAFLKGPDLEFVATVGAEEKQATLTTSPELKPKRKQRLRFLTHSLACACPLCSDVALVVVGLRWFVAFAHGELALGNEAEGLGLLQAALERCAPATTRFSGVVRAVSWGKKTVLGAQPTSGLLDDVMGRVYAALAAHNLRGHQPQKQLWELVEAGLAFLSSRPPHLPGLECHAASLLLTKAVATIYTLASAHDGCTANVFSSTWAWKPSAPPAGTKGTAAAKAPKAKEPQPPKSRSKKQPAAIAGMKPRAKQGLGAKALPPIDLDVFTLGDSDTDVPRIVLKPVLEPATPIQKSCPPPMARSQGPKRAPQPQAPFAVFNEASPTGVKAQLAKAPKASRRVKSRLKVTFSDDSDLDDPPAALEREDKGPAPRRVRSVASNKVTQPSGSSKKATAERKGSQASSSDNVSQGNTARPQRGGTGMKKALRGRTALRAPSREQEEDQELLRAVTEEETPEEELELSFEVLRGSDEEGPAPGTKKGVTWAPGEREVLRRDASASPWESFPAAGRKGSGDVLSLQPPSALLAAIGLPSLDSVCESLMAALTSISHCPPSALYCQLCRLLALCTGSRDPLATACLVSESVAIGARHQMLSSIHRRMHKAKKSGDVAEQLEELSVHGVPADPRMQRLAQLQHLFQFSSAGLGQQEMEAFREQLWQIPSGVTVCILALGSVQPSAVGDTLLLTRLERDGAPVTIRIPTAGSKVPLSSVLEEFDAIQAQQKEFNNCTDKRDWWLGRSELDRRMKSLTETLEKQVLGCWKGALLPAGPDPVATKAVLELHKRLRECGWEDPDPALLKVVLNGAHLLTPPDVQRLALGLCPAKPAAAQALLQAAVEEEWGACGKQAGSSLLLVLDKHLQKLPWENMPCLQALPVTRLPSLHFLLSYALGSQDQTGSVLTRGVDPSRAFYVLNPHGNLPGTEERFRAWFESEAGWSGVTGTVPSREQMQAALMEHDLYIYAGHGAGARFLDGHSILKLDCAAVTLLFGCSSVALAVRGSLEGSGIVLKYIMAGCPLVLGNLWDVTDRDIDRYTEALLQSWLRAGPGAPLLDHVIQARQAPRLKYLIGAAPVAYGLPVSLH